MGKKFWLMKPKQKGNGLLCVWTPMGKLMQRSWGRQNQKQKDLGYATYALLKLIGKEMQKQMENDSGCVICALSKQMQRVRQRQRGNDLGCVTCSLLKRIRRGM